MSQLILSFARSGCRPNQRLVQRQEFIFTIIHVYTLHIPFGDQLPQSR